MISYRRPLMEGSKLSNKMEEESEHSEAPGWSHTSASGIWWNSACMPHTLYKPVSLDLPTFLGLMSVWDMLKGIFIFIFHYLSSSRNFSAVWVHAIAWPWGSLYPTLRNQKAPVGLRHLEINCPTRCCAALGRQGPKPHGRHLHGGWPPWHAHPGAEVNSRGF